jgi:O-succinylbenzoic acid--CoA ligase
MSEATTATTDLVAIDLAGAAAAAAIRSCWDDGAAIIAVDPTMPDAAKTALFWQVRPTAVIDERGRRDLRGTPISAQAAAVVMTSGTGATPKAVILTRTGMQAMALGYSAAIEATAADRWLAALPLSGVAGLAILARSYITGVPSVVHDRYSASAVAHAAVTREATIVSVVPTALERLLDADAPLERFRVIIVGGAPLSDRLRSRAAAAGARLVTSYGLTETWGGIALDDRPISGTRVRVNDRAEIEVSGPMVMEGYRLDREATADTLRDGWLATGDLGTWDGIELTITGRSRDLIITGGVNVSPEAVERVLLMDPSILDAAVVGAPDPEWGERVVAYVVPDNPAAVPSLEHVRDLVKTHLAPPNAPREVHPVSRIPRNAAGKIMRRQLG